MRFADTYEQALLWLRLSFLSLVVDIYAMFRFHYILGYKKSGSRFDLYGMTLLMGLISGLTLNPIFLTAFQTNGFWTDLFNPFLLVVFVLYASWTGTWVFRAFRDMDIFSTFYSPDGTRKTGLVVFSLVLIVSTIVVLILWLIITGAGTTSDSTPFMIVATLIIIYLTITYGLNPISSILSPQRLWAFIIIDHGGLPVYQKAFSKEQQIGDLTLFSGAIYSINLMIKSFDEEMQDAEIIKMEDRVALLKAHDEFLFCLVADFDTLQLEGFLEDLKHLITSHPKYGELKKQRHVVAANEFIDEIIHNLI